VITTFFLHGRISLTIDSESAAYHRYFENEYRRLSVKEESSPVLSVTVRLVSQLPSEQAGDRVRTVRFKKLFTFHFLVRGYDSGNVEIFFQRHPVDRVYVLAVGVFLQGQVLDPILHGKLLEQDALLLHAAGVVVRGGAVLFPAHGGTGKTTLALGLARRGQPLLGDDLIFVDARGGIARTHPRPLHLFSYNLRQMRDVQLPWRLRAIVRGKDILRYFLETVLRTEFLISTRVHADTILSVIECATTPAPVRKIVFLSTSLAATQFSADDPEALEAATRLIVEAADLNISLRKHLLSDAEAASLVERERAVVRLLVAHAGSVHVINPRAIARPELDNLLGRDSQ
jgi:hypothetical protein